jgi:hypothetical protein
VVCLVRGPTKEGQRCGLFTAGGVGGEEGGGGTITP